MDCAYNKNQSNGKKRAFCAIAAFLINAHHITRRYQLECVSKKIITLKNKIMVVMMLMVAIEDILLKRASSNRKEFVVFIDYDDNMMDDDDSRQRSALIMKNRFIASSAAEF